MSKLYVYSFIVGSGQSKVSQYMLMSCHCSKHEPWKWEHTELQRARWGWNQIRNRQRAGDWAPGPRHLTTADVWSREEKVLLQTSLCYCVQCVCVCVHVCEGLAVKGRCRTSQLNPHYRTTCWKDAIWRVGHLCGLIPPRSDPACWPIIHDHMTVNVLRG